ncbi:MAG: hypothetical protein IJ038_02250 [Clostridia bacterium]|nr:hypothetical protein [Clostridia bacterium]
MKKLAKRFLAIALTLVIAASVFVFPTSVNAADTTVTIDFENEDYKNQLNGSDASVFSTVEDNGGKALKYAGTWGAHKELYVLGMDATDTFTMTGDFKFGSDFVGNYSGFNFAPVYNGLTTAGSIFMVYLTAADKVTVKTGITASYSGTNTVVLDYTVGSWCSYEIVRNGSFYAITIWAKGTDKPSDYTVVAGLPESTVDSFPGIRVTNFNGANNTATNTTEMYLDNIVVSSGSNVVWAGAAENFENQTAGSFDASKMSVVGYSESAAPTIVEESGNKYFSFTGISKYSFSPVMSASSYTMTAEIKMTSENTTAGTGSNGFYFVDGSTTLSVFHEYNLLGTISGGGGTKITNAFNGTDWYSLEIVRDGTALSLTMWVKGTEKPAAPTYSVTLSSAAPTVPVIRFAKFQKADTTTCVDNLTFVPTVSPANNVAYQASVEQANDTTDTDFAVRFIATLDSLYYSDVRFKVTARYNDGTEAKAKQFITPDAACVAYTAIIANENNDIVAYDASALGGDADDYLIALNINEIPKAYGTVEFYVEVYATNAQGITVSDVYEVTATVQADNTVTVALS